MAKSSKSFDKAYEELLSIAEKLQSDNPGIDHLTQQVARARELVKLCEEALRGIEDELDAILHDEDQ